MEFVGAVHRVAGDLSENRRGGPIACSPCSLEVAMMALINPTAKITGNQSTAEPGRYARGAADKRAARGTEAKALLEDAAPGDLVRPNRERAVASAWLGVATSVPGTRLRRRRPRRRRSAGGRGGGFRQSAPTAGRRDALRNRAGQASQSRSAVSRYRLGERRTARLPAGWFGNIISPITAIQSGYRAWRPPALRAALSVSATTSFDGVCSRSRARGRGAIARPHREIPRRMHRDRTAALLGQIARDKDPASGALWRSIVSTRAAGCQATLIGASRSKPREIDGCATRPKPCRW
jgi:hypothetical protein